MHRFIFGRSSVCVQIFEALRGRIGKRDVMPVQNTSLGGSDRDCDQHCPGNRNHVDCHCCLQLLFCPAEFVSNRLTAKDERGQVYETTAGTALWRREGWYEWVRSEPLLAQQGEEYSRTLSFGQFEDEEAAR